MPIPNPKSGEEKDKFISRCISEIANEYTEEGQPYAICIGKWEEKFSSIELMRDKQRFQLNRLREATIKLNFAEVGPRGGIKESPKAPKSDTPNPNPKGEGTAKGDASGKRGAVVSARVEKILQEKSDDFNKRYKDKLGYGVDKGVLKTVYQRGVGAYNVSHSPRVQSAEQWALARVNAFLYLVRTGRPENSKYVGDNDLLPKGHKKYQGSFADVLNIYGYVPRYFHMCPGATETFRHLISMDNDDDTVGMIRSAAQVADNVFRIEEEVINSGMATIKQLTEATVLVDDFKDIIEEINDISGMVHAVDYMDGHIEKIKEYVKEEFKSYTDYPDSVKNNAKAVLNYVEKNGWGSCGTPVGKIRANDLAQGNPISEETIRRMYSYLSRHKVDLESSKGYGDGCGKLMYDSWGGLSALSWSESKLKQIERDKK